MSATASASRRLITARQVAAKIGVHPRHIYRLAAGGRLPFGVHVGASRRWDEVELDDWIARGCPPVRKGVR